jgi:sulfonate transport system substrate-binding protein
MSITFLSGRRLRRRAFVASLVATLSTLGVAPAVLALRSARAQGDAGPAELRIGFQKGSVSLTLLKLRGTLDAQLPGTRVKWVEFPAGPQLLEALAVGSIDLGATGDTPPVFAQAAGKALLYVGSETPKPDSSAVLVKADAPITHLADLKGKRIALQKGSSSHYFLVKLLEKAQLTWTDIQPHYLPPSDARAAFERGAIDAWVIWDPYYAAAELTGHARVLATSRGFTSNNSVYLAAPALAQHHGDTLARVFEALTETDAWMRTHRQEAAQRYAEFSGLGVAIVHRFLDRRSPSPVGPITPQILADQQQVADAFARLQLIPRPIRVADAAWQVSPQNGTRIARPAP